MAWGIIIAFATLFGTMVLVLADALNAEDSSSIDEPMQDEGQDARKAA